MTVHIFLVLFAVVYTVTLALGVRALQPPRPVEPRPVRLHLRSGATRVVHGLRCDLARGQASFLTDCGRGRIALGAITNVELVSWSRAGRRPAAPIPASRARVRHALSQPLPPAPRAVQVGGLVRHSLATKVGPLTAASLDIDAETERALGLPTLVSRHLTRKPDEDLAPSYAFAQALGLRFSHHVGLPLAIIDSRRDHIAAVGRDRALAEPLLRRGLSVVLIEACDPSLPWLEHLVPPGWLTIVTPSAAPPHPPHGWTAVGADPVSWLSPSADRLLVPALDEQHAMSNLPVTAARLGDALDAAAPQLAGVFTFRHRQDATAWRAANRACTEPMRRAIWLTRELAADEERAWNAVAAGSDESRRRLRALIRERRRTAAARLGDLEAATHEIAALPRVCSVHLSTPPAMDLVIGLDVHDRTRAQWIVMPLDPGRDPYREPPTEDPPPEICLGGATAPYAEALGARRYTDAARILVFAALGWDAVSRDPPDRTTQPPR